MIDIVELPPDTVDDLSHREDLDDNSMDDEIPTDIPAHVEIHHEAREEEPTCKLGHAGPSTISGPEIIEPPPAKTRKLSMASSRRKKAPQYTKIYAESDALEARKCHLISELRGKTSVECFEKLLDDKIVTNIVQQSRAYARQKNDHKFQLSNDCIRKFFRISLFTGYHCLPQEKLYWNEEEDVDVSCVRRCMSRNRYLEIKRYLDINNNSQLRDIPAEERDKLFKIRPLIDQLNENFLRYGVFSEDLSIDEQMVRYYGHHYLKQFIRGRPVRFGFKQLAICCSRSGYCYQMQVYEGKGKDLEENENVPGLGAHVVMKMMKVLETPEAHKVYFDNFFTGFALMRHLREVDVRATETVRANRINKCPH